MEGDGLGSELTGTCAQTQTDSQGWKASLQAAPPQLEKADAKETLLIFPAWKPVMSSEQENSKRAHLLVCPKLERAESQERCLGANLLACLWHRKKFQPRRKPGVFCLRAGKAGKCHRELRGATVHGMGERFILFLCVHSGLQTFILYISSGFYLVSPSKVN